MAGYSRQSVADIIANEIVKAAPLNAEFNAIRDAFAFSGGHKHDGSSTEGAYVPLIADTDANNKVSVDTSNNRVGVFTEVSGSSVEQVRFQDGVIVPVTDNDIDLGTTVLEFKNLYLDGTAKVDTLTVDENATVAGTLGVTGLSTFASVDINGGNIDGTVIGAASPAAGSFTTVGTSGQATLATVNIDGGTIDGTTIGASTPAAGTFTTVTANTQFTGALVGNVTGNVTGNLTGNVTGNVTGNLTGNVTAGTGTSTFNDVTVNGSLNMNAGTTATITNLTDPTNSQDAATKNYVDTSISNLVDSAPTTLDTLNELAAALGDDPNFATTITNSIATKLPLAGGTMSGAIAMGTNKITGLGDPTANQDAATKVYVDTADATKLNLAGGTMTGNIVMGANKVTSTATPTTDDDLTRKGYVDAILGSATAAADSAAAAAVSEANAATSESNAATSAANAAASYDSFDDRYLGAKSSAPATDNDGDPLITGALYFDTTANLMKVYDGASWADAGSAVNGTSERYVYTATASQTTFSVTYDVGFVDVYLNGVKLVAGTDFTATSGTNIVLVTGATAGDIVDIIAYGAFSVANTYTQAAADAKFLQVANNLSDLGSAATARTNLGLVIGTDVQAYDADTAKLDVAQTFTANQTFGVAAYGNATALSGTTPSVDCSAGDLFTLTTSGNTTFTFTNAPTTGSSFAFILKITAGGTHTLTWPASVDWAGGTAPDAPASGETDMYVFVTSDGGTNWYGFLAGDALA